MENVDSVEITTTAMNQEDRTAVMEKARKKARENAQPTNINPRTRVVAIGSGKGGVGKSTVSVNLAIALSQKGYKVSVFDADIYGPSLPIMTGRRGEKPSLSGNHLLPIESFGIHTLSIGNLVDENNAVIWRGPMVHQAIEQLLRDTKWPGGDFMIIDLPPGTGDVQLSLSQLCELTGSVIVSTPQDVALIDAVKAAQMFTKVEIEVLGITAVAGNVPLYLTEKNARIVCELANNTDVKVFAGCDTPMKRPLVTAEHVHGKTGLDGPSLPDPEMPLQKKHAVDFIIETTFSIYFI